jgi:hypothetical protein
MSETSVGALGTLEAAQLLASLLLVQLHKNVDKDEIRKNKTHHLRTSRDPDKYRRFRQKKVIP